MVKEISSTREAAEAGLATDTKPWQQGCGNQAASRGKNVARRGRATVNHFEKNAEDLVQVLQRIRSRVTWWVAQPYKEADKALDDTASSSPKKVVGIKPDDKTTIIGDPVGREALLVELSDAMIPTHRRTDRPRQE